MEAEQRAPVEYALADDERQKLVRAFDNLLAAYRDLASAGCAES